MPKPQPESLRRLAQNALARQARKIEHKLGGRIDVFDAGGFRFVAAGHPCPDEWKRALPHEVGVVKSFDAAQSAQAEAFVKARAKRLVPLLPELQRPVKPGSGEPSGSDVAWLMSRPSIRDRLARKALSHQDLLSSTAGYHSDADLSPAFESGPQPQDVVVLTEAQIRTEAGKLGLTQAQLDAVLQLASELSADGGGVAEIGTDGPGGVIVALLVLRRGGEEDPTVMPVVIDPDGQLAVTEEVKNAMKTRRNPLNTLTPQQQRELDGDWALRSAMQDIVAQAARRGGEHGAPVPEPSEAAQREAQGRSSARLGISDEEREWARRRLEDVRRRGGPISLPREK